LYVLSFTKALRDSEKVENDDDDDDNDDEQPINETTKPRTIEKKQFDEPLSKSA
jgi:hypothetical protein